VDEAPAFALVPADRTHDLWSAFVQDEVRLADRVRLTLGSKVEHNDFTGWEVEPTLRLSVDFAERGLAWAAVSRAVRTPSRIDREISQPAAGPLVVLAGSPDFRSEEVIAVEAGYRGAVGGRATLSAATFY